MPPVIITPRLLPGCRIGSDFVSVEPTSGTLHDKPRWRWYVDIGSAEYSADDLAGWGDADEMLESLLSFLSACAESRSYARRTGRDGENSSLFPDAVGEWAEQHSDEIGMLEFELTESNRERGD